MKLKKKPARMRLQGGHQLSIPLSQNTIPTLELQDHTAKTQDTLADTMENAEVAEIKRATSRALTRLRAATIKEFDAIAPLETQDIDAYNDAHHYRAGNPLTHLHEDETDMLKPFEMGLKMSWARK